MNFGLPPRTNAWEEVSFWTSSLHACLWYTLPSSPKLPCIQVNKSTFVRAMDASGIGLTQEELGLLINRYTVPAGNGAIDYQIFCDQMNKVRNCVNRGAMRAYSK